MRDASELFHTANGLPVELIVDDVFFPPDGINIAPGEPIIGTCVEFTGYGDNGSELTGMLYTTQLPDEVISTVLAAHDNNQKLSILALPSDERHPIIGCRVVAGLIRGIDRLR